MNKVYEALEIVPIAPLSDLPPVEEQKFDLYGTQGGGLVYWDVMQCRYTFYEPAQGFKVGDFMPEEWGIGGFVKTVE